MNGSYAYNQVQCHYHSLIYNKCTYSEGHAFMGVQSILDYRVRIYCNRLTQTFEHLIGQVLCVEQWFKQC